MELGILFHFAILLFGGLIFAKIIRYFHLPDVTGYLLGGLILGPSVLGLLSAGTSDDLLTISNWKKSKSPVLSFYSVENEYGPGHNSFFEDETGNLMIAYHGETALESNLRCDGIRRVHFDLAGNPVFDLSAKRDLDPELRHVKTRVTVKK